MVGSNLVIFCHYLSFEMEEKEAGDWPIQITLIAGGSITVLFSLLICFLSFHLHTNNNISSCLVKSDPVKHETSGQSYKHFTLVNYDSRVVSSSKLLIFTTGHSTSLILPLSKVSVLCPISQKDKFYCGIAKVWPIL